MPFPRHSSKKPIHNVKDGPSAKCQSVRLSPHSIRQADKNGKLVAYILEGKNKSIAAKPRRPTLARGQDSKRYRVPVLR
jgi:hypothetical protein